MQSFMFNLRGNYQKVRQNQSSEQDLFVIQGSIKKDKSYSLDQEAQRPRKGNQ